jgi:dihydroflavonol-4-reductase
MNEIYIITGAAGFLGNNIVRLLQEKNCEIRCLVRSKKKAVSLEGLKCNLYEGDVTNIDSLRNIFMIEPNEKLFVIHCAAIVTIKEEKDNNVYNVNVNGTKNIVTKVLETNAKLIYVNSVHSIPEKENNEEMVEIDRFDSSKVVGQYAKSKAIAAQYVLDMVCQKNLNACIIQPSGIIGPNDYGNTHLTALINNFLDGKLKYCVRGGYNFVDVRDVAKATINACNDGKKGECYIISNKNIEIKDMLDIISKNFKIKNVKLVPMWLAKSSAGLMEKYYKIKKQVPLYTKYSLHTLKANSNFNNNKARNELNLKFTEFEDTLKDTVLWLKERSKKK